MNLLYLKYQTSLVRIVIFNILLKLTTIIVYKYKYKINNLIIINEYITLNLKIYI